MTIKKLRTGMTIGIFALTAVSVLTLLGCMRVSNGTWYFWNAPVPEGWPEMTPIGKVEVKDYPVYRAAVVERVELREGGMGSMFSTLFNHIKREDIAMTAPVDMGYEDSGDGPRMMSMAFLYRSTDLGAVGEDGVVRVEDLEARTYASVGVRGDYTDANFREGLAILQEWLNDNAEWRADGPPRYLGYNGPFVVAAARYGEVQVPVVRVTVADDQQ